MGYIWKLRFIHPAAWIAIPVLMAFSHWLRGESPRELGFQLGNLRNSLADLAPTLLLIALPLLAAAAIWHTFRPIGFEGVLLGLAAYLPWGLAQEYALNGYFLNRFDAVFSGRAGSFLAASLFCAVHTPNVFLMAVTLPAGWYATLLYRRTHNLYLLGIAHAALGLLLFVVAPDSISHHLRIGPGWFRP